MAGGVPGLSAVLSVRYAMQVFDLQNGATSGRMLPDWLLGSYLAEKKKAGQSMPMGDHNGSLQIEPESSPIPYHANP